MPDTHLSPLADLQRSIGIRMPRPSTPVTVSYPPEIGLHGEPGFEFRFVHHYGATALEAVREVLTEIGRRPADVRVHLTGSAPDISLLARTRNRITEGGDGEIREFAIFCGGITKSQVVEALAALHAQRFSPEAPR